MKKRKKDHLGILKLVFSLIICDIVIIDKALGIRCFSCTVKKPSSVTLKSSDNSSLVRLCSKFDSSGDFEIDCPLSTMCQTRTFQLHTHQGSLAVTTRGCARQDYSYQKYDKQKRNWEMVTEIEESIYTEGCFTAVGQRLRRHKTKYCYCSQDLCNSATQLKIFTFIFAFVIANLVVLI